eukprot:g5101.t1
MSLPYKYCGKCGYPSGMYKYCTACGRNLDRERSKAIARIKQLVEDTGLRTADAERIYFHFVYNDFKLRDSQEQIENEREGFLKQIGRGLGTDKDVIMLEKERKRGLTRKLKFYEYGIAINYLYKDGTSDEILAFLFQCYDQDSDALLDREELLMLLKSNVDLGSLLRDGEDITAFERRLYTWLKKNYALADIDGSGLLNYSEIRELLMKKLGPECERPIFDHLQLQLPAVFKHLLARNKSEVEFEKQVAADLIHEAKILDKQSFGMKDKKSKKKILR